MKICIPTQDDRGLPAAIHPHFGRAPFFSIVDTQTGKLEIVKNPRCQDHRHTCQHLRILQAHAVDTVLCAGMGRQALESLRGAGISVLQASSTTLEGILAAQRAGECRDAVVVDPECGHRHRGGCRHGSGRDHGHAREPAGRARRRASRR